MSPVLLKCCLKSSGVWFATILWTMLDTASIRTMRTSVPPNWDLKNREEMGWWCSARPEMGNLKGVRLRHGLLSEGQLFHYPIYKILFHVWTHSLKFRYWMRWFSPASITACPFWEEQSLSFFYMTLGPSVFYVTFSSAKVPLHSCSAEINGYAYLAFPCCLCASRFVYNGHGALVWNIESSDCYWAK